jgi:hypothetical protein
MLSFVTILPNYDDIWRIEWETSCPLSTRDLWIHLYKYLSIENKIRTCKFIITDLLAFGCLIRDVSVGRYPLSEQVSTSARLVNEHRSSGRAASPFPSASMCNIRSTFEIFRCNSCNIKKDNETLQNMHLKHLQKQLNKTLETIANICNIQMKHLQ